MSAAHEVGFMEVHVQHGFPYFDNFFRYTGYTAWLEQVSRRHKASLQGAWHQIHMCRVRPLKQLPLEFVMP